MAVDKPLDDLVDAIEALIEDMEFRRHPTGTWGGWEHTESVRERLKETLKKYLAGAEAR